MSIIIGEVKSINSHANDEEMIIDLWVLKPCFVM